MIGYKLALASGKTDVLVTLEIPEDALHNMDRPGILCKETAQYRCN